MLETFVSNVPTILFCDPHNWEPRDEGEPYYASLRRIGVLWDSPEAAAGKLEAVYDEPWAWWGSEEVQEVRQNFVERYAYARKDWARCWAESLKREVALGQANVN
jgi:putative transferase (TIGR04331 family)